MTRGGVAQFFSGEEMVSRAEPAGRSRGAPVLLSHCSSGALRSKPGESYSPRDARSERAQADAVRAEAFTAKNARRLDRLLRGNL
jgi:hypothetical protein